MLVIVTGMDNTGKTTLVNSLAIKMGVTPIKSCGPESDLNQLYWASQQFKDCHYSPNQIHLYDRFTLIDEKVYGEVVRGNPGNRIPFNWEGPISSILGLNHLIVYTRPSNRETIFSFGDREQMAGVIDSKKDLLDKWDDLYFELGHRGYNVIPYDYELDHESDVYATIQKLHFGVGYSGELHTNCGHKTQ